MLRIGVISYLVLTSLTLAGLLLTALGLYGVFGEHDLGNGLLFTGLGLLLTYVGLAYALERVIVTPSGVSHHLLLKRRTPRDEILGISVEDGEIGLIPLPVWGIGIHREHEVETPLAGQTFSKARARARAEHAAAILGCPLIELD